MTSGGGGDSRDGGAVAEGSRRRLGANEGLRRKRRSFVATVTKAAWGRQRGDSGA